MATSAYLTADATVSAHKGFAITPNDATVFGQPTRGIYVGGSGTIVADLADGGTALTFVGAVGGTVLPLQVTRVYLTGTTASELVGLY